MSNEDQKDFTIENIKYPKCNPLSEQGKQSKTYRCQSPNVIIKQYEKLTPISIERVRREIEALKQLSSCDGQWFPKFVASEIINEGEMAPVIVMSDLKGVRLSEFLEKNEVEVDQRLEIFSQILERIGLCHQLEIIHFDLKPDNILVNGSGEDLSISVVDFGLSAGLDDPAQLVTYIGGHLGPQHFRCPEADVLVNFDEINKIRFDVYSLGKLLYYVLRKNKDNHGYFPREKHVEIPWKLPTHLFVFTPTISSVVTESEALAKIKDVDGLKGSFEGAYKLFLRSKESEGNLDFIEIIEMDEKLIQREITEEKEKILAQNRGLIINRIGVRLKALLNKQLKRSKHLKEKNSHLLSVERHLGRLIQKAEKERKLRQVNWPEPIGLGLKWGDDGVIFVTFTDNPSNFEMMNVSLALIDIGEDGGCNFFEPPLLFPNSTTMTKDTIIKNVDGWFEVMDVQSLLDTKLNEVVPRWLKRV